MIYFLDTEFIDDGKTIDLISLALVSDDGRELYLESSSVDLSKADDWLKENVFPHLFSKRQNIVKGNEFTRDGGNGGYLKHEEFAREIRKFIGETKPQFWGYYADYDWVAFCQCFGKMIDLPNGYPMYCRDIKQLCDSLGNPKLPDQPIPRHHALNDARWTCQMYEYLRECEVRLNQFGSGKL